MTIVIIVLYRLILIAVSKEYYESRPYDRRWSDWRLWIHLLSEVLQCQVVDLVLEAEWKPLALAATSPRTQHRSCMLVSALTLSSQSRGDLDSSQSRFLCTKINSKCFSMMNNKSGWHMSSGLGTCANFEKSVIAQIPFNKFNWKLQLNKIIFTNVVFLVVISWRLFLNYIYSLI